MQINANGSNIIFRLLNQEWVLIVFMPFINAERARAPRRKRDSGYSD